MPTPNQQQRIALLEEALRILGECAHGSMDREWINRNIQKDLTYHGRDGEFVTPPPQHTEEWKDRFVWFPKLKEKMRICLGGSDLKEYSVLVHFIETLLQTARREEREKLMDKFIEVEKNFFNVTSHRYIVMNEETIESLERGERRAVPIRSLEFPTLRTEPPTLEEFNKNTIILKRD